MTASDKLYLPYSNLGYMRIYYYVILLLLFLFSCKSDNFDKNSKTELLKDGSISLGSKHWQYASHKWGEYGKPSELKDFIGNISHEHFSSSPTSLMISRLQVIEKDRNAYWYQNIANPSVPKGSNLVLRVKIKTENVEGDGVSIYMHGMFDNDKAENYFLSTEGRQRIDGTSDFITYELGFDNYLDQHKPTENLQIGLHVSGVTKGVVYFDDVSLRVE